MSERFKGTMGQDENGNEYRQTTLVHLNGNILCAVDVKTTGLDSTIHEIYEIGILPIDSFFARRKDRIPLDLLIRPNYPEKIDRKFLEKINCASAIDKALISGLPQHVALRLFERWVGDLQLNYGKKIAPIGYDYAFESRFLRQWLGHLTYKEYFDDSNIRDIRVIARFLNDLADIRGTPYPYNKVVLSWLCKQLKVNQDYGRIRSAIHDTAIIADVYREMMKMIRKEMII